MNKKIPMRKCVGCGEMKLKKDLIRVVKLSDNDFDIDLSGKKNGRGAYLCNEVDCLVLARKKGALQRSFKTKISEEIYDKLEASINE